MNMVSARPLSGTSPLESIHSIMEELADLASVMESALHEHQFDKLDGLAEKNTVLRARLSAEKADLAGFTPETAADLALVRDLRGLTERVAAGDRLFLLWKQDLSTYRLFGMKELRQSLLNMKHLRQIPRVGALNGVFKGRPAIIVAAGPSRDKQFPLLKKIAGQAVVITLNRCVDAFVDEGIVPDMMLVTDSQAVIPRLHLQASNPDTVPTVVSRVSVHPEVFDFDATRRFCYTDGHDHETGIMQLLGLKSFDKLPGMSVAHSSLLLAYHMGCNPIIMVGQDLAFTGDRYYAASDKDDIRLERLSDGLARTTVSKREVAAGLDRAGGTLLVEVPGFDGTPVETNPAMAKMITYFEVIAEELEGNVELINATEGGAFLKGMSHRPFQEVVDQYCQEKFDPSATLEAAHAKVGDHKSAAETLELLKSLQRQLAHVRKLTKSCLKLVPLASGNPKKMAQLKATFARLGAHQEPLDFLFATASILGKLDDYQAKKTFETTEDDLSHSFRRTLREANVLMGYVREALADFEG